MSAAQDNRFFRALNRIFGHTEEPTVTVLGHKFHLMSEADYEGLAGAAPGSFICYHVPDCILVWSPDANGVTGQLSEIITTPDGQNTIEFLWTKT